MADAPLRAAFRRPFAEQVAAFRLRLRELIPTVRWDDIAGPAHDRGFMVAGAVKADLLADLAAAVDRAITQGTGFDAFKRDFRAIVERRGWHGWTGEGTAAGEEWRMRTIYRTNLRTTYMAGRRAQLVAGEFAFWVYRHSGARHPRLDHLSWDGLALPPDHPFWDVAFPPNGWGCGCAVYGARTAAGVRRLGGDPDKTLPEGWDRPDPRTGLPRGIQRGWGHAPGAGVGDAIRDLAAKPVDWDYSLASAYMRAVPERHADLFSAAYRASPNLADELRRWVARIAEDRVEAPGLAPIAPQVALGLVPAEVRARLHAMIRARNHQPLLDVAVDVNAVRRVRRRPTDPAIEPSRNQRPAGPADFARLGALLNAPDSTTAAPARSAARPGLIYRKRFGAETLVGLFEYRASRGRLDLVRLWVERGGGASPAPTP